MSDTALSTEDVVSATQVITPYLMVRGAEAALAFYAEAFGAFEQMRVVGDDGRIGHCEFTIGGSSFMMADEYPEMGFVGPETLGGTSVALYLHVVDVDEVFNRAVAAGAEGSRPPANQSHGNRQAAIVDPFGHRWMLSQSIEALSVEEYTARETVFTVTATETPVEPGYLTIHTPDTALAAVFYGELFAWTPEPGNAGEGYAHIANTRFPMGMAPPVEHGPVTVYFRVDDIERYAAKVVELGGQILSRNAYESGGNAECVDNQGTRFDLFQPAPGY